MRKTSLVSLLLTLVFFVSCGDDDKLDLSISDPSFMTGTYAGTCKINVTGIVKEEVSNESANVVIGETTDGRILKLERTDEFTNILGNYGLFSSFRYTDGSQIMCNFNMSEVRMDAMVGDRIPSYVTGWFGGDYTQINQVSIDLIQDGKRTPSFLIEGGFLTFMYTGTLKMNVTVVNKDSTTNTFNVEYGIQYLYSVVKI